MPTEQVIKRYSTFLDFKIRKRFMERKGYRVVQVTNQKDSFHASKAIVLGAICLPFALFGRGKSHIIVTYEK